MSRTRVCDFHELVESQGRSFKVGDERVAVFRVGQTVYALRDICPHAGAPLSNGAAYPGDDGKPVVVCPVHYWLFSLEDGTCPYHAGMQAVVFPAAVEEGAVWVELPEPQGK